MILHRVFEPQCHQLFVAVSQRNFNLNFKREYSVFSNFYDLREINFSFVSLLQIHQFFLFIDLVTDRSSNIFLFEFLPFLFLFVQLHGFILFVLKTPIKTKRTRTINFFVAVNKNFEIYISRNSAKRILEYKFSVFYNFPVCYYSMQNLSCSLASI